MSGDALPAVVATPDVGGPFVAVCTGHRCAALHRLAEAAPGEGAGSGHRAPELTDLRGAVRQTRGAVLLLSQCLGPCSWGAVCVIGLRGAGGTRCSSPVWLGGIEAPARTALVRDWVAAGGPGRRAVPGGLADAVIGEPPGAEADRRDGST